MSHQNNSIRASSSPFSHPEYLDELQMQKRQAFNSYLDNLAGNMIKGAIVGGLLSFILVKKTKNRGMMIGLCSGIGAGMATNQVASSFNRIEQRETRINSYLNSIDGASQSEIQKENEEYAKNFEKRLNLWRFKAFQKHN